MRKKGSARLDSSLSTVVGVRSASVMPGSKRACSVSINVTCDRAMQIQPSILNVRYDSGPR